VQDLFVPLTGRLGADAPVDFIIASLTSGVGFLIIPMVRLIDESTCQAPS